MNLTIPNSLDHLLFVLGSLLLLSVILSKLSSKWGVPILIVFLGIGMLAGSDGPGGIEFEDPFLARDISTIALSFILFTGGLDTKLHYIKDTLWAGVSLSTLGVIISMLTLGMFAHIFLNFGPLESLLFGAIASPTDAAVILSVLRNKATTLKQPLQSLIELEAGSNDPIAIMLTLTLLDILTHQQFSFLETIRNFTGSIFLGVIGGIIFGQLLPFLINKLNLEYEGLYPVLTISMVILTYSLVSILGGSGFLAVYILGLLTGQKDFINKREIVSFHEGWVWFMQVSMFLTLGLLVFPSQLLQEFWGDIIMALILMFIARPLSVFLSLLFSKFSLPEKLMLSWVGLRGAVPIILATFPFVSEIPKAQTIFNSIFFIVLTSIVIQAPLIPKVIKWLNLEKQAI